MDLAILAVLVLEALSAGKGYHEDKKGVLCSRDALGI